MKFLFSFFAVLTLVCSESQAAGAAIDDSTSLLNLPFQTVIILKKDIKIMANDEVTTVRDWTAEGGNIGIEFYVEKSNKARVLKSATRTVFNSVKTKVPLEEIGYTGGYSGQTFCGAMLFLNTEGGTFFEIQVHKKDNCDAIPTIGDLKQGFDVELQDPDVIG